MKGFEEIERNWRKEMGYSNAGGQGRIQRVNEI